MIGSAGRQLMSIIELDSTLQHYKFLIQWHMHKIHIYIHVFQSRDLHY